MRNRRSACISILAVFFVMVISLGSAGALDYFAYQNTWYKTKFKIKAVCDDFAELEKESVNATGWIYIQTYDDVDEEFDGFLVTQDEGGPWQATAIVLSTAPLGGTPNGNEDDAILELVSADPIIDGTTGVEVEILSFFMRLTGKEKNAALKSAKLKSITGAATLTDGIAFCYGLLSFKGNLKAEEKVPTQVFNAVSPPLKKLK